MMISMKIKLNINKEFGNKIYRQHMAIEKIFIFISKVMVYFNHINNHHSCLALLISVILFYLMIFFTIYVFHLDLHNFLLILKYEIGWLF